LTRWIVDGMNVIGSRPTGWWHDRPGAMRDLVYRLGKLGEPVTVIFDGRPFEIDDAGEVDVRFASRRGRNAADDDIARMASEGDVVVTSDDELVRRVTAKGATVTGAGAFRRALESE
jgi:uncharacterized protein YaiI (UPF0178 family)